MREATRKENIISVITFCLMIVVLGIFYIFYPRFDFKNNGKYSIAEIYDFHVLAKSNHSICFKYSVNNQQFKSCQFETFSNSTLRWMLLGKKFPIIYNPEKPENCNILITEHDFKRFGLEYPDSLSWVEDNR